MGGGAIESPSIFTPAGQDSQRIVVVRIARYGLTP